MRASFRWALVVMACYFLLCLRLTYFKEWYWDADVNKTYSILSCLNRTHQVTHVTSTWAYHGPLNFYQIVKPTSIQTIDEQYDADTTQVYVVDTLHSPEVLKTDNLRIFYRSPTTDLVLAAKPALAESAKNCCP